MNTPYQKTVDGFEYQFQVNYLSHYLLTRLLINSITNSSHSRIINLTSKLYESKFFLIILTDVYYSFVIFFHVRWNNKFRRHQHGKRGTIYSN